MGIINWVVESFKKEFFTSVSLLTTILLVVLTNTGVIKPYVFEIHTRSFSLLSTNVEPITRTISLVSVSIAVSFVLLVYLFYRKRVK